MNKVHKLITDVHTNICFLNIYNGNTKICVFKIISKKYIHVVTFMYKLLNLNFQTA